ncbi:hypothetical protein D3C75_1335640 [compost metagenome]
MEFAHQLAKRGVDLLVALDPVQAFELCTHHYSLVVGLQPTTVHVAFVQHLQMLGL